MTISYKNTYQTIQQNSINAVDLSGASEVFCMQWFSNVHKLKNFYFTKSGTQALELSLLTLDLPEGSEVILPSFAFVSLANAVNNIGLKCIFVDCEKSTMNIDASRISTAITDKTKAIITINYGGISCDYKTIKAICKKHKLFLIEDNAHGVLGKYEDQFLGSIGDISTFSFDHLKNFSCFQGGGVSVNNQDLLKNYYITSDFGTNRRSFLNQESSCYEWNGKGTNSILAKPLYSALEMQLKVADKIILSFNSIWNLYYNLLSPLKEAGLIDLAILPRYAGFNAHVFWVKAPSNKERTALRDFLKGNNIEAKSHYEPLHSSSYGRLVGEFRGKDMYTSSESKKLLRLPLYYGLSSTEVEFVVNKIKEFYKF